MEINHNARIISKIEKINNNILEGIKLCKNKGKKPIQALGFKKEEIDAYRKLNAIPKRKKKETLFIFLYYYFSIES